MEQKLALGTFIQHKRKEHGFTQKSLAEQLFVTESAVSKWERGISYPDITLVRSLCKALGITEHELVTASEDFHQRKLEQEAKTLHRLRRGLLWVLNASYSYYDIK
jgi:transcriptional regulator with XRE-family HTH domain